MYRKFNNIKTNYAQFCAKVIKLNTIILNLKL